MDCDCGYSYTCEFHSEIRTLTSEIEQLNSRIELLEAIILKDYKLTWEKKDEDTEVAGNRFKIKHTQKEVDYGSGKSKKSIVIYEYYTLEDSELPECPREYLGPNGPLSAKAEAQRRFYKTIRRNFK